MNVPQGNNTEFVIMAHRRKISRVAGTFFTGIVYKMPSSVIRHFRYDAANQRLRVLFVSGIEYDYENFPKEVYEQMRMAYSKGKFLNENIKGKYSFKKVKGSSRR
jgi:KTSC domain